MRQTHDDDSKRIIAALSLILEARKENVWPFSMLTTTVFLVHVRNLMYEKIGGFLFRETIRMIITTGNGRPYSYGGCEGPCTAYEKGLQWQLRLQYNRCTKHRNEHNPPDIALLVILRF
jgi:hypothetical protein